MAVRELAETLTVELEPLPEAFTIPLDLSSFVGEAYGPVLLNAEWHLEPLPFPIKVDHLLSNEVTLTREPETGEYKGSFQLNGLAELLFQGLSLIHISIDVTVDAEGNATPTEVTFNVRKSNAYVIIQYYDQDLVQQGQVDQALVGSYRDTVAATDGQQYTYATTTPVVANNLPSGYEFAVPDAKMCIRDSRRPKPWSR